MMNITPQEADTLFDTALDVLNNVDNVMESEDGLLRMTIYKAEWEAFSDAVAAVIKANPKKRKAA